MARVGLLFGDERINQGESDLLVHGGEERDLVIQLNFESGAVFGRWQDAGNGTDLIWRQFERGGQTVADVNARLPSGKGNTDGRTRYFRLS